VQIADLIAHGTTNKNIAYELHLGEGTIKTFVSVILAKTGMANRTSLAVWWDRMKR
jgi:DNA-binding NarL/FixJ family response regulator